MVVCWDVIYIEGTSAHAFVLYAFIEGDEISFFEETEDGLLVARNTSALGTSISMLEISAWLRKVSLFMALFAAASRLK